MVHLLQTYIEYGTRQQFHSFERYAEDTCTATPKVSTKQTNYFNTFSLTIMLWYQQIFACIVTVQFMLSFQSGVNYGTGKRSFRKSATSCSSVAEEEVFTPKALKFSVHSTVSFKTMDFIIDQELTVHSV